MKKYFQSVIVLLAAAAGIFAQQTFLLKDASKKFDVKIKIEKCVDEICEGTATVYLLRKNQTKPLQTIQLSNLFLELGTNRKPTTNLIELYGDNNSGVVFDDYNFDGAEDIALRNGNDGAYGGPSFDILLFNKAKNNFVKNRPLTVLASENLGLFSVHKKNRTIETFNKSGCCRHQTTRYQVIGNRPKKVYVFTEDASSGDGIKVYLTTERLIGRKWKTTKKTALIKDYYKEQ